MKKNILLLAFAMPLASLAQDMIVKKDGSIIQAKVSEIGTTEVKYKKWSNQDGPSYTIDKSTILAITYQNGEKETFEETSSNKKSENTNLVQIPTASNNKELIAKYNREHHLAQDKKASTKSASQAFALFSFTESSILSNEEVEMSFQSSKAPMFYNGMGIINTDTRKLNNSYRTSWYAIIIKNKTDKTIYIDLARCYKINEKEGSTYCYYRTDQLNISNSSISSTSFNLGGITGALGIDGPASSLANATTISNGTSSSVGHSYSHSRVVTIPPYGIGKLCDFVYTSETKDDGVQHYLAEIGESFYYNFGGNDIDGGFNQRLNVDSNISKGEEHNYDVNNSPCIYDYNISYSSKEDFSSYSILKATLYISKIIGSTTDKLTGTNIETLGFKSVVNMITDYDANSTICGQIRINK